MAKTSENETTPLSNVELIRLGKAIFGIDASILIQWPGFNTYGAYLQRNVSLHGKAYMAKAIENIVKPEKRRVDSIFIDFVTEISALIRKAESERSLDEIVQSWIVSYSGAQNLDDLEKPVRDACRYAVFSILCWTSLLAEPYRVPEDDCFRVVFPKDSIHLPRVQPMNSSQTSTSAIFRGFCGSQLLPDLDSGSHRHGSAVEADLIYVSSINYDMLQEFGRVTIKWTNLLSCHLMFIEPTRTLYLFSLPTVCALACLQDENGWIFDSIVQDYLKPTEPATQPWPRFRREVLLSYRLLFGQSRSSRELFKSIRKELSESDFGIDPLLDSLCSKKTSDSAIINLPGELWPKSCLNIHGKISQLDEYSISSDLPLLGPKLLALQTYCLRQRPKNIWALWRDKRDKPKWYTFWAVTIIGFLALLIGVVQIALSAAQLAAGTPG